MSRYQSVFRDETKLDINYVPHKLPHRNRELQLLTEFFSFILQFPGRMAQRVVITGDVGTGKTVLSQRFGANMTSETNKRGINFRYVHINCREYRGSLFLILLHIISVFHPNFPKRGYSAEELLPMLLRDLDDANVYVIVTLDEFDSLIEREGSEAVYELTRLQEARQNKPQRLSFICVLRNLKAIERLDISTRSTLQSNVISLEKYSKQQLIDILSDRVLLAFRSSAVAEDTIGLIAEVAFSENGNARFGIEVLWRAGKYADVENSDAVAPEFVRRAVSSIVPTARKSDVAFLSFHEKLFLLGATRLFKESQKAYLTLPQAEQAYTIACEEFTTEPHSHTQLWNYLQHLSVVGILKTEVSSTGTRGRSTLIYLPRIPTQELQKELEELLKKEEK